MFEHVFTELTEMNAVTTERGDSTAHLKASTFHPSQQFSRYCPVNLLQSGSRVGHEEANRISHRASSRGTRVHEIVEKYINNEENFKDGYTPDIISSFSDLKPILDNRIGRVFAQEAPLYSNHLGVAGRVDCIAEFDGRLSVIDFKTSMKPKRKDWITNYFMQESAYAIMWEERTGRPITQLVTIISVDNHEPQIFVEHRDTWVRPLRETIAQYNAENSHNSLDI